MHTVSNRNMRTGSSSGTRPQLRVTPIRSICCWLIVVALTASGCRTPLWGAKPEPVYIPGTQRVESIKKGQPAPDDGFFVPPAVMAELGPALAEPYRGGAKWKPTKPPPTQLGEPAK